MDKIILASKSPRRMEILKKFSIPFTPVSPRFSETFTDEPPADQVLNLSKAKIKSVMDKTPETDTFFILGADTCIDLGGRIMGKPENEQEALDMLLKFSGTTHRVITGLTLYNGKTGTFLQEYAAAEVTFSVLSGKLAEWYIKTGEWRGAAGGYRIQEKGALLIESIKGDYYTVMGLPIRLFYGMLASQNPDFDIGLI